MKQINADYNVIFIFQGPDVSDWRSELLNAIGYVFAKEREALLAQLRSHVLSHPNTNLNEIQKLEHKIRNQVNYYRNGIDFSLMKELDTLHISFTFS